ncbi:hypothetical protein TNCV_4317451 [Trichonephila clavipes]|nr:hypothetical protein TNCV_4317451 [Trichonephila clavipes]
MPSSGFEPSPYGTAVSVSNHSTGWVTCHTVDSGRGSGCFPRNRFVALNPIRVSSVPLGIPPPPLDPVE